MDRQATRPIARLVGALPSFLGVVAVQSSQATAASVIAEQLVEKLGALTATVYLVDRASSRTLRLAASKNVVAGAEVTVLHIDLSSLPAARAARAHALQIEAASPGDVTRTRERMSLARCGSAVVTVALPLLVRDRLLGVVCAELAARLDPAEVEELESLGVVLGAIVDRARLQEELEARDEWTRVIAHEVRQPLNTMSLHANWLERDITEGPNASAVRHMLEGVRRVNRLVGDLLDTTLNDIANVELCTHPTDLVALASGLAGSSAASRVKVEALAPVPQADVDPERIEQVLANLLVNALKYGRRGSEIKVAIRRCGDDEVALSVTNEGNDIAEHELRRVFDRYYRAHKGTADGWGIGLYVCRGLVEAHGGRISVQSGGGRTTFSVVLPIARPGRRPMVSSGSGEWVVMR